MLRIKKWWNGKQKIKYLRGGNATYEYERPAIARFLIRNRRKIEGVLITTVIGLIIFVIKKIVG